jgi:hypothetical protein
VARVQEPISQTFTLGERHFCASGARTVKVKLPLKVGACIDEFLVVFQKALGRTGESKNGSAQLSGQQY